MLAFILAGGFATRLWPLTEKRAKPLLPLLGKPILSHIVEKLPREIPVTVSTNAALADGFEVWKRHFPNRLIEIVVEQTTKDREKLGALGAVAQWVKARQINDDLLLLTGDNYFGFSFEDFLAAHRPGTPLLAAYDIGDRERAKQFGTVIVGGSSHQITAFEEKPKEPQTTLVSTGCSMLPAVILPILLQHAEHCPDNVGGLFEELLLRGIAVDCFTFHEPWFDVGSFESYLEATKALVSDSVLLGENARIEGATCEGSVVLGEGSRVTGGVLRDTVIFDHCTISDCILERCIVDNNSTLRGIDLTGKMLREGTVASLASLS